MRDSGKGELTISTPCSSRSTPRRSPAKGVGLGLAISVGIVTDLGGRLTARNGESGGCGVRDPLPLLAQTEIECRAMTGKDLAR